MNWLAQLDVEELRQMLSVAKLPMSVPSAVLFLKYLVDPSTPVFTKVKLCPLSNLPFGHCVYAQSVVGSQVLVWPVASFIL